MTGITAAIPYAYPAAVFIWYPRNTSESAWLYWAPYLMAAAATCRPTVDRAAADGGA